MNRLDGYMLNAVVQDDFIPDCVCIVQEEFLELVWEAIENVKEVGEYPTQVDGFILKVGGPTPSLNYASERIYKRFDTRGSILELPEFFIPAQFFYEDELGDSISYAHFFIELENKSWGVYLCWRLDSGVKVYCDIPNTREDFDELNSKPIVMKFN